MYLHDLSWKKIRLYENINDKSSSVSAMTSTYCRRTKSKSGAKRTPSPGSAVEQDTSLNRRLVRNPVLATYLYLKKRFFSYSLKMGLTHSYGTVHICDGDHQEVGRYHTQR